MIEPTRILEVFPDVKDRSRLHWIGEAESERIEKAKEKIREILSKNYPGLWEKLKDFQKQDIAIAVSKGERMRILLAHDMGLGKTLISAVITAVHALLYKEKGNILVIAPTTSGQYINFANELRKWKFKTVELEGPLDILKYLRNPLWRKNKTPTFFIISESKAKLTSGIKKVLASAATPYEEGIRKLINTAWEEIKSLNEKEVLSEEETKKRNKLAKTINYFRSRIAHNRCPVCGREVEDLKGNKPVCKKCQTALKREKGDKERISTSYISLWTAYKRYKVERWPLHKLIKRYGKGFFQYFIVDEAHEEKKEDSSRGTVVSSLSNYIPNVLYLTGTPFQGKSSQLFYILGRLFRWDKRKFPFAHDELSKFVERYGVREIKIKEAAENDRYQSWRSRDKKYVREAPGIGNKMLWLLLNQVMVRRKKENELKGILKEMSEYSITAPFSEEHLKFYEEDLIQAEKYRSEKPPNYSAAYWLLMKSVNLPAAAGARETIGEWGITNKDKTLLNLLQKLVLEEKRKVLVFTGLTDRIPAMSKLYQLIKKAGYRTELWPAGIPNKKRPEITEKFARNLSQVAVASLGAYNEGLNITGASAVIFYEPYPRPEFYKQAKDRIWRIGQGRDTKSYLLYIDGSVEKHTWDILITKIDTMSKFINGELPPTTLVQIMEQLNKEIIKEAVEKTFEDLSAVNQIKTKEITVKQTEKREKPVFIPVEQPQIRTFYQPSLF